MITWRKTHANRADSKPNKAHMMICPEAILRGSQLSGHTIAFHTRHGRLVAYHQLGTG